MLFIGHIPYRIDDGSCVGALLRERVFHIMFWSIVPGCSFFSWNPRNTRTKHAETVEISRKVLYNENIKRMETSFMQ